MPEANALLSVSWGYIKVGWILPGPRCLFLCRVLQVKPLGGNGAVRMVIPTRCVCAVHAADMDASCFPTLGIHLCRLK